MELQLPSQSLIVTDHAWRRMLERKITEQDIKVVWELGTREERPDGSTRVVMDCDAAGLADAQRPYNSFGIVIVVKEGNVIVTVYNIAESADGA